MVFLLAGTLQVQGTEAAACFAEPTQDCAFDLAFETADRQTNPQAWAQGLLALAAAQESAGSDHAEQTLSHLLDNIETRLPEPGKLIWALGFDAVFKPDQEKLFAEAPVAAGRLAAFMLEYRIGLETEPRLKATAIAIAYLAFAGTPDRAMAVIEESESEIRAVLAPGAARFFIRDRDIGSAWRFVDYVLDSMPKGAERDKRLIPLAYTLSEEGYFDAVAILASTMHRTKYSVEAQGQVAWQLFVRGRVLEARRMIADMKQRYPRRLEPGPASLIMAFGKEGDGGTQNADPSGRYDKYKAIAAITTGDLDRAFDYLRAHGAADYAFAATLNTLVSAYVRSGQIDLSPFFEQIPREHLAGGLSVLGKWQAELGDLDGSWRSFAEALTHGAGHPGSFNSRFFALERLLLERGDAGEALRLAHDLEDSKALARLAAMMGASPAQMAFWGCVQPGFGGRLPVLGTSWDCF